MVSYCLTARRVLFLPPWPEDFPPATGNTNSCINIHSVLNHMHWLKIWEPHIRCQLLQISLRTSDEVSPKCSKLTTRPKRCENMLCFDWTLASFTAKNTGIQHGSGILSTLCCVSAVIEHHALIYFFYFLFFSVQEGGKEKRHAPAAWFAHVIKDQT